MKKVVLSVMLIWMLVLSVSLVGAVGNGGNNNDSAVATATATATGGDAVIQRGAIDVDSNNLNVNTNTNVVAPSFKNTNTNVNKQSQGQFQGQEQRQGQGQFQGQNNNQTISPKQEVNIDVPNYIGSAPNAVGGNELNFISPSERDVQTLLPKFGCGNILPLKENDCIVGILWQKNDIKFKDLYASILKGLRSKDVLGVKGAVRYQIREAASTKTWTTSGSGSGNGLNQFGGFVTGATASIVPSIGRSKSSNLYTIIFVQVQTFK